MSAPLNCSDVGILTPAVPREEIRRGCRLLMQEGDVHELRVITNDRAGTISGCYDSADAMANAALALDGRFPAIYCTLNPVLPSLLARACNRTIERVRQTTSDSEIHRRRWLLINLDPKRPAGISSSDVEHGRAIATACGIWDDLHVAGWPDPVVCDSGNGAHLLYRIALPNHAHAAELVKHVLAGIAARCAPNDVDVDTKVFNAARITKLYGTMVKKGDNLPSRPHRRSRVLEIPKHLSVMELS